MVMPRPVDIHDSPAPRCRARMIHQRPHAVADLRPVLKRRLHRHRLAPGYRTGALPQPIGRDRLLQQTSNGGNDQRRRAGRPAQRPQRPHPLLNRARLDGETLVRQHFRLCEVQQWRLVVAVRLQLLDQSSRVVRVRTDDQQWTLEVSPQAGDHHRLGCFRRRGGWIFARRDALRHAAVGRGVCQHVHQSSEAQPDAPPFTRVTREQAPHALRGTLRPVTSDYRSLSARARTGPRVTVQTS